MSASEFVPPGRHPQDQARQTLPPVDFQVRRLRTELNWVHEHAASLDAIRASLPDETHSTIDYLNHAAAAASKNLERLVQLLDAGNTTTKPPKIGEEGGT